MKRRRVSLPLHGWDANPSQGYPLVIASLAFCHYPFILLCGEGHCDSNMFSFKTQHIDPDLSTRSPAHWPLGHHASSSHWHTMVSVRIYISRALNSPCDRIWTMVLLIRATAFTGKPKDSWKRQCGVLRYCYSQREWWQFMMFDDTVKLIFIEYIKNLFALLDCDWPRNDCTVLTNNRMQNWN